MREREGMRYEMPGRAAFATPRLAAARACLGQAAWDEIVADGRHLSCDAVVSGV